MASASKPVAADAEIPSCVICCRDLSFPVKLACGHVFDLDCISDWARRNNTCPFDRSRIDVEKNEYDTEIVRKVSSVFCFRFLMSAEINPLPVNIYSSVQRLKELISMGLSIGEKNLIQAAFSHRSLKFPREFIFLLPNRDSGLNKRLHSDTIFADHGIEPEQTYTVSVLHKMARYEQPCDHCYNNPDKEQTCRHPD